MSNERDDMGRGLPAELEEVASLVASAPLEEPPLDLERSAFARAGVEPGPRNRVAGLLAPGLAVAALALAVLGVTWHSQASHLKDNMTSMRERFGAGTSPMAGFELSGFSSAPDASIQGELLHNDGSYQLVVRTDRLPPSPPGSRYELWLRGPGGRVSAGSFRLTGYGPEVLPFTIGVDPMTYPRVEITLEPADGDPSSSGDVLMTARLVPSAGQP